MVDEQRDPHLERSQQWLEHLLQLTGLTPVVKVEWRSAIGVGSNEPDSASVEEEGDWWLVMDDTFHSTEQIQTFMGEDGSVLDAMQYLSSTILNMGVEQDEQRVYTIELGGYRLRRQQELWSMAKQAAVQVRETGEEQEIKDLSSAERRQVHTFLKSCTDLETYSRGREPDRRLVIRLKS